MCFVLPAGVWCHFGQFSSSSADWQRSSGYRWLQSQVSFHHCTTQLKNTSCILVSTNVLLKMHSFLNHKIDMPEIFSLTDAWWRTVDMHTEHFSALLERLFWVCYRFENEMAIRQSVEGDIAGLRKVIDDTNVDRVNVESEIESLNEELVFLKTNHENVNNHCMRAT